MGESESGMREKATDVQRQKNPTAAFSSETPVGTRVDLYVAVCSPSCSAEQRNVSLSVDPPKKKLYFSTKSRLFRTANSHLSRTVMPASLFADMEPSSARSLQEHRALELAYEMSMLGFNNENESLSGGFLDAAADPRGKKSQNTTECVPVPSSEHVAEIVGRQGCKIKALRAKTNTYIKTPVRGEEPVFVVTGRKEDVAAAKREILSAAEHFSQIRAQRKNNLNGSLLPGPNSNIPGQTTIQVRVPYRVVGLVVGPKGATIKRIQQQTSTYIVTPSRDKEPIFEVTGLPDSVETARKEIEAHIAMRTGNLIDSADDADFDAASLLDAGLVNNLNVVNSAMFKNGFANDFVPFTRDSNSMFNLQQEDNLFGFPTSSSMASAKHSDPFGNVFGTSTFGNGLPLYDADEGLGDSPTFDMSAPSLATSSWPDFASTTLSDSLFGNSMGSRYTDSSQRSNSISGALADFVLREHPPARRIQSDPEVNGRDALPFTLANAAPGVLMDYGSNSSSMSLSGGSASESPTESLASKAKRECIVCFESSVVAALVPCGHNLFCYECASRICEKPEPECPICHQPVSQAIRILS